MRCLGRKTSGARLFGRELRATIAPKDGDQSTIQSFFTAKPTSINGTGSRSRTMSPMLPPFIAMKMREGDFASAILRERERGLESQVGPGGVSIQPTPVGTGPFRPFQACLVIRSTR